MSIRKKIRKRLGISSLSKSNDEDRVYRDVSGIEYFPERKDLVIYYDKGQQHDTKKKCLSAWWEREVETSFAEMYDTHTSVDFTEPYPKGEWDASRMEFKIKPR